MPSTCRQSGDAAFVARQPTTPFNKLTTVVAAVVVAAGLGVLIWWLVTSNDGEITVIDLEGEGFDGVSHSAGFTSISGTGDLFWLFYPTTNFSPNNRPIILFLDGVMGLPPSLWANFGMFGPLNFNLNRREESWVDSYNLLFMDAPMGTGFSTVQRENRIPRTLDGHADQLVSNLESFYSRHRTYGSAPLYILGEGHGAQLALALAVKLTELHLNFAFNLQGVVIGNGIVSPAAALTRLGFYLEELGYIDGLGREVIENFSNESNTLVNNQNYDGAFDHFLTLGEVVNENAGAIAVNLGYIVEKLTRDTTSSDPFGMRSYVRSASRSQANFQFMEEIVAPALGISNAVYDGSREVALDSFRSTLMVPSVDKVEYLLQNTAVTVSIYNGNLDAVSNTPGQLEWVNNLDWSGQAEFLNSSRVTLVVDRLVQGYFRETSRLKFYWINAAGVSVPYDSPRAMRRVLNRITGTN